MCLSEEFFCQGNYHTRLARWISNGVFPSFRNVYNIISVYLREICDTIRDRCVPIGSSLKTAYCTIRDSRFGEAVKRIYNTISASPIGVFFRRASPCLNRSCIAVKWLCSWVPVIDLISALYILCFQSHNDRITLVEDITEKENTKQSLLEEKERLECLFYPQYEQFEELHSEWTQNHANIKTMHRKTITVLLECFHDHLTYLLTPNTGTTIALDQKKQYGMYGLLKSASISGQQINNDSSPEEIVQIVKAKYPFVVCNEVLMEDNVQKSLSMTWSMLTLLPPLLVVTTIDQYNEQLHDTNRHTWEEDNGGPLYYYRPILVYGNGLHVAVKGLVGNAGSKLIEI